MLTYYLTHSIRLSGSMGRWKERYFLLPLEYLCVPAMDTHSHPRLMMGKSFNNAQSGVVEWAKRVSVESWGSFHRSIDAVLHRDGMNACRANISIDM